MKIKDLPNWLQEKVIANQKDQGNKPNYDLELDYTKPEGNFNWDKSPEGLDYWDEVDKGNFIPDSLTELNLENLSLEEVMNQIRGL